MLEAFNYEYLLQGGSPREIKHLQQIWKSGDFISYDFGTAENLQVYHSVEALSYNISQITVPIILYFGETDAIATPEGVHAIYARMLRSVKSVRRINSKKFNHLDFLISGDVKSLVNDKLIEHMEQFFDGRLPYVIEWPPKLYKKRPIITEITKNNCPAKCFIYLGSRPKCQLCNAVAKPLKKIYIYMYNSKRQPPQLVDTFTFFWWPTIKLSVTSVGCCGFSQKVFGY